MNNYDKILEIIKKNNGYVTTKEVVNRGINKMFLTKMVRNGQLVRISRGYYGIPEYVNDTYYVIASKSKNAVFSLATALYLHNLSDRTPLVYNITLPYDYKGILQKDNNVIINYVSRDIINLGVIEMTTPFGMKVRSYDVERTICDIIKNKNKMDSEIFSKAMKLYAKSKEKNLSKLRKYAKAMKIEKKVNNYMEVLL